MFHPIVQGSNPISSASHAVAWLCRARLQPSRRRSIPASTALGAPQRRSVAGESSAGRPSAVAAGESLCCWANLQRSWQIRRIQTG